MANILEYLTDYCDALICKEAPLNELDAAIFARFSYLPFSKINFSNRETIFELAAKMKDLPSSAYVIASDAKLLQLMAASSRFAELKVSDLVSVNDEKNNEQFLAVSIHLPGKKVFVTYVGTDESLHGWREDCNLAIYDQIPSQLSGAKYLRRIARKNFWKQLYVGGHSKGGNVAIYSALVARDFYQGRIIKVYSFDGPGLSKKLLAKDLGKPILPKIINYIPQDSVIGRLFTHEERVKVVKSTAKSLWQHDIYTWEVNPEKYKFVRSTSTKKSDLVDKTLAHWMDSASNSQKKAFTELVFKVLRKSRVGSPIQIANSGLRSLPALIKSFSALSREEKGIIAKGLMKLVESIKKTGQDDET